MPKWFPAKPLMSAAILALAAYSSGQSQNNESLGKLFSTLDRPVLFEEGISEWPLEKVLDHVRKKANLELVIDTEAFEKKLGRKDVAKTKISFDRVSGIPASLFLDALLHKIDGHFETREGKVYIVPATNQHSLYHPACLPSQEARRAQLVSSSLKKPVTLTKGLSRMEFGEAKGYFEDRFGISILIDQGLFPKGSKNLLERPVELPPLENVPLEAVLESLAAQMNAAMETRGGTVLIVPKEPNK